MKNFVTERTLPRLTKVEMSETESLEVRSSETKTVSVIAVIFNRDTKSNFVKVILSEEYIHKPKLSKLIIKMPTISLQQGENWKDALNRKLHDETGLEPQSMKFGFTMNSNSNDEAYKEHLKIYVFVTSFRGTPRIGGKGNILSTFWANPRKVKLAKAQEMVLPDCFKTINQLEHLPKAS